MSAHTCAPADYVQRNLSAAACSAHDVRVHLAGGRPHRRLDLEVGLPQDVRRVRDRQRDAQRQRSPCRVVDPVHISQ
jgi:hypothetical protein